MTAVFEEKEDDEDDDAVVIDEEHEEDVDDDDDDEVVTDDELARGETRDSVPPDEGHLVSLLWWLLDLWWSLFD